jgi:hypothetical protein
MKTKCEIKKQMRWQFKILNWRVKKKVQFIKESKKNQNKNKKNDDEIWKNKIS